MNKFIFWFKNFKKLSNIKVVYSLITKNGNKIYSIEETQKSLDIDIRDMGGGFKEWRIEMEWIQEIENSYKYQVLFNHTAEKLLNEMQKSQRNTLNQGYLDGGDYIVKVVWDVDLELEDVTYEEYIDYLNKNKNEGVK